jgi:hypothetical protein
VSDLSADNPDYTECQGLFKIKQDLSIESQGISNGLDFG